MGSGRRGALQAILFWHAELSRFIETFPRGLPGRWPQDDVGVILWGLSHMAGEWQSVDTLVTLCAVPDDSVANMHWNAEGTMFAGRVLGPLRWFGLLECPAHLQPPQRIHPSVGGIHLSNLSDFAGTPHLKVVA